MHSMTLEPSVCSDLPDCECEKEGEIEKDITANTFTTDKDFDEEPEQETGDVVEETIEETKEEVEKQKEELKDRDFDPEKDKS